MIFVSLFLGFMALALLCTTRDEVLDDVPEWVNDPGEQMRAARELLGEPCEVRVFPRKF